MKNADNISEDTTLKITDLISNLNDANAATNKIKQQLHDFQAKKGRLPEVVSEKLQAKTERQTNYKIITKDVSKWQNIVKKNREIEHLDLTNKIKDSSKRMYFFLIIVFLFSLSILTHHPFSFIFLSLDSFIFYFSSYSHLLFFFKLHFESFLLPL